MKNSTSALAQQAIFEIIENQLRDNSPLETRQTLDRLMRQGYSREETMKLIGCALASEIFDVLNAQQPYQAARYVANLQRLPTLPWE